MAFVDLVKAFDECLGGHLVGAEKTWCGEVDCTTGPGDVCSAQSHVHVGVGYSDEFDVKVCVHQGWVLSPLLFIMDFFINMQVQEQHPHQWAPFQVAGLLHAWQVSHQISRCV